MKRRKTRENNLTQRYLDGEMDSGDLGAQQRFGSRSKDFEAGKILKTALLRAQEQSDLDVQSLPTGDVFQVFSLFSEVRAEDGKLYQCVVRKTLSKLSESAIVVGDKIRFRDLGLVDEQGKPQAVIEQVLPRSSILTRSDSFKGIEQHPIVANAQQMLIVASAKDPTVRWGLVDRMLIAAQGGNLKPIICLNKIDLGLDDSSQQALDHYKSMDLHTLTTSVPASTGLEELRQLLANRMTVLAGHSGVGKSTLINAVEPALDLRTAAISNYTGKGRHTTTSARRYPLSTGGAVVDTPGVKLFGLWGVTRDNLLDFFPDIAANIAPDWRTQSFDRILKSLPQH
jgi:ribosome biogenesis GTPase